MRRPLLIAIIAFLAALALRVANAPVAFAGGAPQISPIDELYHWKRISFSAAHVGQALEFDPDRAAFCPWPPLYDITAGAAARILGARDDDAVLRRIVWFPPLLGAAFVGIVAFFVTRHFGPLAGTTIALALAGSPFLVTQSSIGDIDHHFLEAPLTFGIVGTALLGVGAGPPAGTGRAEARPPHSSALLMAAAILAALFVQTALIIAAGLAFIALFVFTDGRAGSIAFAIAAAVVALYRLTRADGYPDGPWFLGWTHVALLAGAAIALRKRPIWIACAAGVALLALPSVLEGTHFFIGDPWLRTIVEFQPIWKARDGDLLSLLVGLGAGALLVWPVAMDAWRRRDAARGTIALFAIIYLLLTLSSRRFWSVGIPLLALAGAVYASKLKVLALAAVALVPPIQFALWMQQLQPPVDAYEKQWIAAAQFLRRQPAGGRVLAPWWLGHTLDVIGKRSVLIDNFGSMPDPIRFEKANEALLSRDETRLADYCQANGVNFVVLTNPLLGTRGAAAVLGLKANPGRSTWWWRTYFSRRAQRFHLAYHDWRPEWQGAWMAHAQAMEIWEFDVRRDR